MLQPDRSGGLGLHQANLREDPLAGQQLGGHANHKAQHRQTAIPFFGKGGKAKLSFLVLHGFNSISG
ncbi:hypothetical protein CYA_2833 [Synechococcus sp. JA-3-3Ab]|nr:hypothetical protein CYA_2833 [Synechococcus sp. JA-3-3Ab]